MRFNALLPQSDAAKIVELGENLDHCGLPADVAQIIKKLWGLDEIQAAYARSKEFQLYDSAK